jgi:hypothetical protein
MNTTEHELRKGKPKCTRPTVGMRLSKYLADSIAASGADEVEEHLLECRDCRAFFLRMLHIRNGASKAGIAG